MYTLSIDAESIGLLMQLCLFFIFSLIAWLAIDFFVLLMSAFIPVELWLY